MSQLNNEFDNLLELFSNFYQAIIINESDKERLQSSLYEFRSTFEPKDLNFNKTKLFLNQMRQGIPYNPYSLNIDQNPEKKKCQTITIIKKNQDYDTYQTEDYINY